MKTKILIALFASLLIVSGCGNTDTHEVVEDTSVSNVEKIFYSLPAAYFEFYFPVGIVDNGSKEKVINTTRIEDGYLDLRVKDTVSGTVRWSMKVMKAEDGKDVVVVSDVLETEKGIQQHLYIVQKQGDEWNDNTKNLLVNVMDEASKIPLKDRVIEYYEDDVEDLKLRSGMFILSQDENKLTSAIANAGEIELPLYNILWDGSEFILEEIVPSGASNFVERNI